MPKTNHDRNFVDTRDYSVPPGDWVCGKHGAANNRRGAKKGVNRRFRSEENRDLRYSLTHDEIDEFVPGEELKQVAGPYYYKDGKRRKGRPF